MHKHVADQLSLTIDIDEEEMLETTNLETIFLKQMSLDVI
jgi:hypothetical protein